MQLTQSENAALARMFSSSVIRELAQKGSSQLLSRLINQLDFIPEDLNTLSELFDWAYKNLRILGNRHEYIYKNAIAEKILLGKHSLNTSCMLSEFRVGSCRADVVILNGTSTVYEIKSEKDRLDRLERQISEYLTIFDLVQIITTETHLFELEKVLPNQVGIQLLTKKWSISEHRPATSNIINIKPEKIFESLRKPEYLAILKMYDIPIPEVPNTQIFTVAKQLFNSLTPKQAHIGMVEVLKYTRNHISLQEFIGSLPDSLKSIAITTQFTKKEQKCFLETINKVPNVQFSGVGGIS